MSRSLNVPGSPSSELQTRYFSPGILLRHEAPLEAGRKARAAAAAQRRLLDFGDDLLGRDLLGEDLLQRLVAAARLVVVRGASCAPSRPVMMIGVGAVIEESGRRVQRQRSGSAFTSRSQFVEQRVELVGAS